MKRWRKISYAFIGLVVILLAFDYVAYNQDEAWYARLNRDLPVGTSIEDVRAYFQDDGKKHGISGLHEDLRPDMRGFIFLNHNRSIITRSIVDGFDWWLLFGNVAVRLDENERVKEIYIFK